MLRDRYNGNNQLKNPVIGLLVGSPLFMVISIASQKGGTGKTTTSLSLSAGLARLDNRVLLVDMDSQANSSKVLIRNYPELKREQTVYTTILERKALPIHRTHIERLDMVPAH